MIRLNPNNAATQILNFFQTSKKILYSSNLIAFVLVLFAFPAWQQVFAENHLPGRIQFIFILTSIFISLVWMTMLFVSSVHLWQRQPDKRFGKWTYILGMSVAIGGFWVLVFYPALMSPDSLAQWNQALEGKYIDWYPVGMTILMKAVIVLFSSLSPNQQVAIFAFLQGTLFWFSIFYAVDTFIASYRMKVFLYFLIPFYYPIWAYSVILWKDVWVTIWFLLFICELYNIINRKRQIKSGFPLCFLFSTVAIMTRHNVNLSILLFSLIIIFITIIFKSNLVQVEQILTIILAVLISSLVTSSLISKFIYSTHVNNMANFSLSYDLFGTLYFSGEKVKDLTFLKTYQEYGASSISQAIQGYTCGEGGGVAYLAFGESPPLKNLTSNNKVVLDMFQIVPKYPIAFLKHKICAVSSLLQVSRIHLPYHPGIDPNTFGIISSSRLPKIESSIYKFLASVSFNPKWFWLSVPYRHYLVLSLAIISCFVSFLKIGQVNLGIFTSIFLLAAGVSYFFPYLIVSQASDWRYLLFSNITWMLSTFSAISCCFSQPVKIVENDLNKTK